MRNNQSTFHLNNKFSNNNNKFSNHNKKKAIKVWMLKQLNLSELQILSTNDLVFK